jgi:hypothetical protein
MIISLYARRIRVGLAMLPPLPGERAGVRAND